MLDAVVLIVLFFAIIILWISTLKMIEQKAIKKFLPFFIISIAASFSAGFTFFEVFNSIPWTALEASYFFILIWIIVIV